MLLGEHLGRGEQRRLPAGVDDLEHRAQRHQRLAGADLALEQPVHRVVAGQLAGDDLADLALAPGELERQPGVEGRQEPVGPTGARAGALRAVRGAAPREHELEHQRLLEAEALLRRTELAPVVGAVDPPQRLHDGEQVEALAELGGEDVGHAGHQVEGGGDDLLEVPV